MQTKQDVALRKRQQIAKASQMMFLWVAGASVIVGASVILLWVIGQKLIFNEKVLAEKTQTVATLQHNNSIVDKLKDNVRVLNTNQSLIDLRTPADSEPVQVVFDALPSTANSAALGASLQSDKLLGQPGITIESLTVSPVEGVEDEDSGESDGDSSSDDESSNNAIEFEFSVSAGRNNADALKDVLKRLERSIRGISIATLQVEQQGSRLVMTVTGEAYYEPAKNVELQEKAVRP